ncbi:MAG: DUF370 domain-containing protein [Clostridiales bacterium]|jgi:hypothetical protein|nr:DUF370 domain-containing protein [Clostridiales bacterium]MCI2161443.1 DUF370 domain-containing protein [Oscillospiraceae bacterium]CAB1243396.1 putative Extracellular matrix regulatory protein B [Ruminococcaceae bacterium BL-4]MCI1961414.1 DUF370 domain-containing protein [Clostridiales bacterium]MCI2022177.1 DUF370 domain-containing protein [Clostridiales bacterium]
MYLHLGQNTIIHSKDIIGIFDLDVCTVSKITREMLTEKEKQNHIVTVSQELPKSFVLCSRKKSKKFDFEEIIYLSQLNSATLLKRMESMKDN